MVHDPGVALQVFVFSSPSGNPFRRLGSSVYADRFE